MIRVERQTKIGLEGEIRRWFLTLLIATAGVMGYCVYLQNAQNNPTKTDIGSGLFDVTQQMKQKWEFDPNNPIDRQIVEMDKIEPFIGIGRGK